MAFGDEECETTQVTIPKDVSNICSKKNSNLFNGTEF